MSGKTIPQQAVPKDVLMAQLKEDKAHNLKWEEGKSFCLIYYPGNEYSSMIKEAYNLYFTENALNPMSFPSLRKYESDIVSMVTDLMNGDDKARGSFTSGGTESILLAVKTARDYYRIHHPDILNPEIILPVTAHPAFAKACHYFNVKPILVEVNLNYEAEVALIESKITASTIMLVASTPSYPQGVMDPIEAIAELALKHQLLFHVDACIGGFVLPFLEKLNYPVPPFDFRLKGVSSMSVDLHKFGYAAKGASVILYRNKELRKAQYFVSTSWPGGMYGSAGMSGSRPGGAISAAYAALIGIGKEGYLSMAAESMKLTQVIRTEIEAIPELRIMGNPVMTIIAFTSDVLDIYELADELNVEGWHFERLQNPPGIHLTIHQIHTRSVISFLDDLKRCVIKARKSKVNRLAKNIKIAAVKRLIKILPQGSLAKIQAQFSGKAVSNVRTAPMYGMMGALKGTEDLDTIILDILDKLYTHD
jgi:glutamate/tyrosine decarboxylase-like PLP-dependent enzyme